MNKVYDVDSEELFVARNSREEVINSIFADLDEAIKKLPKESELDKADKGRVTVGAAQALKARLALYEATWKKYHQINEGRSVTELLDIAVSSA